jgi:hypothetical protein
MRPSAFNPATNGGATSEPIRCRRQLWLVRGQHQVGVDREAGIAYGSGALVTSGTCSYRTVPDVCRWRILPRDDH